VQIFEFVKGKLPTSVGFFLITERCYFLRPVLKVFCKVVGRWDRGREFNY